MTTLDLYVFRSQRNAYGPDGQLTMRDLVILAPTVAAARHVFDDAVAGRAAAWGPDANRQRNRGGRRRNRKPKVAA